MNKKYYTGVGSRETPNNIILLMQALAYRLSSDGWTLRSGAATGADSAFELGWFDWWATQTPWPSEAHAEIYLPWDGYNNHTRDGCFGANILPDLDDIDLYKKALEIAESIHPNWKACKQGARKMHARNVFQVLGRDLVTPSKMLVAWTPVTRGGKPTGGTATAINLAIQYDVPTYNLNIQSDLDKVLCYLR